MQKMNMALGSHDIIKSHEGLNLRPCYGPLVFSFAWGPQGNAVAQLGNFSCARGAIEDNIEYK